MSGKFSMDDYVDVAERERQLFERYPDARVQVDLVEVRNAAGELNGWAAKATIWRTPDDPVPVCDWAVEPVPGKTPYTRDSEAMNASTSAVGRAIVLAGFPSKKIASADEVRARSGAGQPDGTDSPNGSPGEAGSTPAPDTPFKAPTGRRGGGKDLVEKLRSELVDLVSQLGATDSLQAVHEKADAGDVAWLKRQISTAKEHLSKQEPVPFE